VDFKFTDFEQNGRNEFTFILNEQNLGLIGDNLLAIIAELANGEKIELLGSMTVVDVESICNFASVIPDKQFDIPERAETLEVIYQPTNFCSQGFILELANGQPAPDYYRINSQTGLIELKNKSYQKVNDALVVVIGGVTRSNAFNVKTVCGPDSTVVEAPEQSELDG
jgi:hypothetical protein